MRSVRVVLPESIWALIPMFRICFVALSIKKNLFYAFISGLLWPEKVSSD